MFITLIIGLQISRWTEKETPKASNISGIIINKTVIFSNNINKLQIEQKTKQRQHEIEVLEKSVITN